MKNITIGTRLYLGFGALLALLFVLWGVGKWGMASFHDAISTTLKGNVKIMELSSRARANALGLRRFEKDVFINIGSAKDVEKYRKGWDDELEKLKARIADLEKVATLPNDKKIIQDAKENLEKYGAGFIKVYQKIQGGEIKTTQDANQAMVEVKDATHNAVKEIENLAKECSKHVQDEEENLRAFSEKIGNITLFISIISLFVGIFVAWLITRAITRPLNQMQTAIGEVEKSGDLTRRIAVNSNDEVGQTAKAFNDLMGNLQTAFSQIHNSVDKIFDASRALSASSQQVAAGSAHQSEAASAIAATVEQVTVSINHVAESAQEALQISQKSGDLSDQGSEIIHNAATEMQRIADTVRQTSGSIENLGNQSSQISSIVQVIKEIAEQTNLLALNAAIEAARAGEQGRGFAVVADEVRKLAERTAISTKEISQMIDTIQNTASVAVANMSNTVKQVSGGAALAQQAGDAINQIKEESNRVIRTVSGISSSLVEQSKASNDISAHVEKVAQMTEENHAATEATANAADNLAQLAGTMRIAVERFKI